MTQETGVADKRRLLAALADNVFGGLLSIIVVGVLSLKSDGLSIAVICLIYLFYFVIFEVLCARTPGKMLTGLIVCKIDGTRIGIKEAAIRTVLRVLEVNPLLLGGLPAGLSIMFTKRKQRLGDLAAGTLVVPKKGR